MTESLQVQHRFKASPERVFEAFVEVKLASQFLFATPTGEMVVAELEPCVGGAFRFIERRDGQDIEHLGTFVELVRPSRVAFDFQVPAYSPLSTRVTVDIEAVDGGTLVTLTHEGVPPKAAEQSAGGWSKILASLARVLGS